MLFHTFHDGSLIHGSKVIVLLQFLTHDSIVLSLPVFLFYLMLLIEEETELVFLRLWIQREFSVDGIPLLLLLDQSLLLIDA